MNNWLLKCEPDHDYSYQDLENDGQTYWDGVTNNWALKSIREVEKGDKAFIYHTGEERCVTGVANIASDSLQCRKKIFFSCINTLTLKCFHF